MQHDELIGKVQALAQLPGRGPAERATQAVLTTLAERVPSGLAHHMAAQLPPELAVWLRDAAGSSADEAAHSSAERFDLATFAGRVAARAGTDESAALREAAAVLEVLDAALAPELMENLTDALPADIGELLPSARATDDTD
ncbi:MULTISPECIES: DUF2267 domain-containing protein [unclassified Streptomyces]|uniref:DUF2267 domain-containing protein n=2 Tax=Streptomyces TaxID=1883 RepID=A0ABU2RL54_9ACTN|nr:MULTISPECIES: DUF2267 domain-containing protein [unclassified Streptomyces]HBF80770.1 DUF2267 domain-containing protein [Streptomyces sp.]AEN08142.1 Protein of unknown function DUF2267 [Streptomyces sp. SirexAA-E]MBK3591870.1 DUF2267 domain-containing protein [Streptomyces sp. MBT51]MDT0429212.1 DUF2267 domain-containing protein [Streptomyces sp. DSM 41770]MYR68355.1 DUF2267 domain-containing protein [Streptomyces sp. SID4939]